MAKHRQDYRRLDTLLLDGGYFAELKVAQGWVMAGKVVVDGVVVTAPGTALPQDASIHLRGLPLKYASRGGYKLERALQRFGIAVAGKVCLDAGASTGGFTDCLLQHGAARVYAVEAGYGQFRGRLAGDARVISFERTNIGSVERDTLQPPIALAVADLSYLSLTKAVPTLHALFVGQSDLVCLVKPLYEGLAQADLADPPALSRALGHLFEALAALGHPPVAACVSPLLGGNGAVEFLSRFGGGPGLAPDQAVAAAMADFTADPPVDLARFAQRSSLGSVSTISARSSLSSPSSDTSSTESSS